MNREKVIRTIEGCINFGDYCNDCAYDGCIFTHGSCEKDLLADALAMLKEQPEIVRCKYCEYLSYPANGVPFCKRIKNFVDANWFCADGKKAVK